MNASFPWMRKTLRTLRQRHGSHQPMEVIYRDLVVHCYLSGTRCRMGRVRNAD
jgi:hypothetical protein